MRLSLHELTIPQMLGLSPPCFWEATESITFYHFFLIYYLFFTFAVNVMS